MYLNVSRASPVFHFSRSQFSFKHLNKTPKFRSVSGKPAHRSHPFRVSAARDSLPRVPARISNIRQFLAGNQVFPDCLSSALAVGRTMEMPTRSAVENKLSGAEKNRAHGQDKPSKSRSADESHAESSCQAPFLVGFLPSRK